MFVRLICALYSYHWLIFLLYNIVLCEFLQCTCSVVSEHLGYVQFLISTDEAAVSSPVVYGAHISYT